MRRLGQRKDDVGCAGLIVEEQQERRSLAATVRPGVHARRELLQQPARLRLARKGGALLRAPGQILPIEPNQHRGSPRYGAEPVLETDLQVPLGEHGQVDANQGGDLFLHRTGGDDELARRQRLALAVPFDLDRAHTAGRQPDPDDLRP